MSAILGLFLQLEQLSLLSLEFLVAEPFAELEELAFEFEGDLGVEALLPDIHLQTINIVGFGHRRNLVPIRLIHDLLHAQGDEFFEGPVFLYFPGLDLATNADHVPQIQSLGLQDLSSGVGPAFKGRVRAGRHQRPRLRGERKARNRARVGVRDY